MSTSKRQKEIKDAKTFPFNKTCVNPEFNKWNILPPPQKTENAFNSFNIVYFNLAYLFNLI